MPADIHLAELRRDRPGIARFLAVPFGIYQDDPNWVAPHSQRSAEGPRRREPVLLSTRGWHCGSRRATGGMWARSPASSTITTTSVHGEATAFFGFFEAVNDRAVSRLLFGAVRRWAAGQGMRRLLGPDESVDQRGVRAARRRLRVTARADDDLQPAVLCLRSARTPGFGLARICSRTTSRSTTRAWPVSIGSRPGPSIVCPT